MWIPALGFPPEMLMVCIGFLAHELNKPIIKAIVNTGNKYFLIWVEFILYQYYFFNLSISLRSLFVGLPAPRSLFS